MTTTSYKPDICIYHGGCDDGFAAAWAIWKRWPATTFVAGYYGKPLPEVNDDGTITLPEWLAKQKGFI